MSRSRPFAEIDVFSATPYLGNPVAVILDADDVDDDSMKRVARWTNLSETVFLLTPTDPAADYRARILTPGGELPFAGHPTLGAARAWLENGGTQRDSAHLVQECAAGLIRVKHEDGVWSFAAPPTLRSGELEESHVQAVADAFGVARERIIAHQWVDNGPGWAVVQLATAQEVIDLEPDLAQIPDAMIGALGAYPNGAPHAFEMRAFAPRVGVPEDPVCGSINAAVAQWLLRTGAVPGPYRVSQGQRVGRAGAVTITLDPEGTMWVGGATNPLVQGHLFT